MIDHTFIYGAGSLGKVVFDLIKDKKTVTAFIDDAKCDQEHYGVPVISMSDAPRFASVYIAITPCIENCYSNIVDSVKRLGFSEVIDFFQIMEEEPNFLKLIARTNYLWMRESSEEMLDLDKIEEVRSLLCDNESKALLDSIVDFRGGLLADLYVMPSEEVEYFPSDIIRVISGKNISFIDCGAFTGDTIEQIFNISIDYGFCLNNIYTFEIDCANSSVLKERSKKLSEFGKVNIINIPAGVWNEDSIIAVGGQTASSRKAISDGNENLAPVFALDSILSACKVDFIKLDVEGAELRSLKGAEYLISSQRPIIAVCLYHKPEDLWEIPLYINKKFPFYKMCIKQHDHLGIGLVLYCFL